MTVVLSEKGWIRAAKGHDVAASALSYRDGAALQGQREHPPAPALVPAEREQAQRAHGDAGQAQLDRQHQPALVADVLQHV
ncbi:hypothetical protein G6F32_016054 [Rhizopus arrhizus]|nr:hypothetical protein G6F32_016054 [Rhizopus arrhizus]